MIFRNCFVPPTTRGHIVIVRMSPPTNRLGFVELLVTFYAGISWFQLPFQYLLDFGFWNWITIYCSFFKDSAENCIIYFYGSWLCWQSYICGFQLILDLSIGKLTAHLSNNLHFKGDVLVKWSHGLMWTILFHPVSIIRLKVPRS